MSRRLTVISSVAISTGCSMRHRVHGESVDFFVEDGDASAEITIDVPALRELLRLGEQALAESALQTGD